MIVRQDAGDVFREDCVIDALEREFGYKVARFKPTEDEPFPHTDIYGYHWDRTAYIAEIKCRPNMNWGDHKTIFFEKAKYEALMRFKGQAPLWFVAGVGMRTVHILDVTDLDMSKVSLTWSGRTTDTRPDAPNDPAWFYEPAIELFSTLRTLQRPKYISMKDLARVAQ